MGELILSVLVLRHESFEHLGHFSATLDARRVAYAYHELGDPIGPHQPTGIIALGGPMSANDPSPGLADEIALIEKALQDETPVLGICLGSQLLARALGARVYRDRKNEIGW